ncbi:single-stranded DNA-binding protein 4 isoform X5 [Stegostoma tigrinum]|uniref:single-stranded DNA-binding protein 4 isoform X5 n=1 Tax=Stegostoma tigrinum TaxID=3053191 RepID=UPI00286FEAFF|nr:single-stranded DNA-binding protein 4 isoform X5 [Stegostoma tigrinum]
MWLPGPQWSGSFAQMFVWRWRVAAAFDRCVFQLGEADSGYVHQRETMHHPLGRSGVGKIRWEKNITLGEPPGFLHAWWCVFWDLYCAAPDRRETCEPSSEAKAFHDYRAATGSPVLTSLPPGEGSAGVPLAPGLFLQGPPGSQPPAHTQTLPHNPILGPHTQPFMSPRHPGNAQSSLRMSAQPAAGMPGSQPLLLNTLEPTRQEGPLGVAGPIQRTSVPRGLTSLGPQSYGGPMLPPSNSLGCHGMLAMNLAPGGGAGRSRPNPVNTSTFQMGPGAEGSLAGMAVMESHHINGALGTADMDGLSKNSPNNMTGVSNPLGTPRDDGELAGNFLNPFQNESYSPRMTMSV